MRGFLVNVSLTSGELQYFNAETLALMFCQYQALPADFALVPHGYRTARGRSDEKSRVSLGARMAGKLGRQARPAGRVSGQMGGNRAARAVRFRGTPAARIRATAQAFPPKRALRHRIVLLVRTQIRPESWRGIAVRGAPGPCSVMSGRCR